MDNLFELIYHGTLVPIMIFKLVCLIGFLVIMYGKRSFFAERRKWQYVFFTGCLFAALGLIGDILDGRSSLQDLHLWAYLRHVGVGILFFGAYGLHWPLWRKAMFRGSVFQNLFLPEDERR